jgi:hypothetical protein
MTLFERIAAMTERTQHGREIDDIDLIYNRCTDILTQRYKDAVNAEAVRKNALEEAHSTMETALENLTGLIGYGEPTIEDCANLAICIIAAWTYRVRLLDLKWWETSESKNPDEQPANSAAYEQPTKSTTATKRANSVSISSPGVGPSGLLYMQPTMTLQDLPAVSGLG